MSGTRIRKPQVAGQFYPASEDSLKEQIGSFVDKGAKKRDAVACMLPHAGYLYSGYVAAQTVSQILIRDKVILLGPNHTGLGAAYSIMTDGVWQTPLGDLKIDSDLAGRLLNRSKRLREDHLAHLHEHSLEVELPILQYFKRDFQIVPIAFMSEDLAALKEVGEDIAACISESRSKGSILIVASSDMTHYETMAQAKLKDDLAIQAILEFDAEKLFKRIKDYRISMCGYAPVTVMISILRSLGSKNAQLIKYQTSAEVTNDKNSVVGYAGAIFI